MSENDFSPLRPCRLSFHVTPENSDMADGKQQAGRRQQEAAKKQETFPFGTWVEITCGRFFGHQGKVVSNSMNLNIKVQLSDVCIWNTPASTTKNENDAYLSFIASLNIGNNKKAEQRWLLLDNFAAYSYFKSANVDAVWFYRWIEKKISFLRNEENSRRIYRGADELDARIVTVPAALLKKLSPDPMFVPLYEIAKASIRMKACIDSAHDLKRKRKPRNLQIFNSSDELEGRFFIETYTYGKRELLRRIKVVRRKRNGEFEVAVAKKNKFEARTRTELKSMKEAV